MADTALFETNDLITQTEIRWLGVIFHDAK